MKKYFIVLGAVLLIAGCGHATPVEQSNTDPVQGDPVNVQGQGMVVPGEEDGGAKDMVVEEDAKDIDFEPESPKEDARPQESFDEDFSQKASLEMELAGLFTEKYGPSTDRSVQVDEYRLHYASGFVGSSMGGGGMFIASDILGEWEIVFDGNGFGECAPLEKYSVPVDMMSECLDEDGEIVER